MAAILSPGDARVPGHGRKTKLEDVTFHTLRHTAASLMAQAGVPVTSIGRSSATPTRR